MGLKEILEAKRLAAAGNKPAVVEEKKAEDRQEAPSVQSAKPMSFADKMKLKRDQEAAQIPAKTGTGEIIDDNAALRTGKLIPELEKHPVIVPTEPTVSDEINPETAQAYADIKSKIDSLEALAEGPPLEGAMKEIKSALMKNPAAVELMLDRDIGQMVIALRRITKEAVVEAAAEKKSGTKKKNKPLTVEDIDKVFDEL